MEHTYKITGMTCAGCQYKVQTLLSGVNGVKSVNVDLPGGEARVEMESHIDTNSFKEALKDYPKYQISDVNVAMPKAVFEPGQEASKTWIKTYKPILLIFGYVLGVSISAGSYSGNFEIMTAMRAFMAGFFLVFSFFKMLNLEGFAESYAMYDVIARKFNAWGYIYAFIELALGFAYAVNYNPLVTNTATILVMGVSIIGVLQSVLNKRAIKCACLGAVFNLPMSTVTIIEDGLMIAMSAAMLAFI
ncbi:heavy-metal-associated domain-containing protein [Mucilaginibacter ginkgonis]|uniref:Cation transporter n=1 Tax=Mucilaginibacter ginkgonis TaxID=2682091 RepID=A0A6I4I4D3_9SPHI|nr:heavy metal-associated domain-containing protein [Mucilaginibacter ginkgonis]QQL50656.1 cation transporter [Mucilaginibacter ginkgonis]